MNLSEVCTRPLSTEPLRVDACEFPFFMQDWAAQGLPVVAAGGERGSVVEPEPPEDDRPEDMQRLQSEFLEVIFAVQEHFGDREPSEEEIQEFLRQRMIDQGKTVEEADEFLAAMGTAPN